LLVFHLFLPFVPVVLPTHQAVSDSTRFGKFDSAARDSARTGGIDAITDDGKRLFDGFELSTSSVIPLSLGIFGRLPANVREQMQDAAKRE
jgi:hypothetical protein